MSSAPLLNRKLFLQTLSQKEQWDLLVIGGGATGLGIAVDSAARGFSTLLLEQADFAKGTSSRSTKLVHGGVRYLAQGNIRLVYEALHERQLLLQNAPHLVKKQSFVISCYSFFSKVKFFAGLKIYDWLSGGSGFGKTSALSRSEVVNALPGIKQQGLVGGVEYFDGQFDDARLAINLAQTAAEQGAVLLNYCKVTQLLKENGLVCGVHALDMESQNEYAIKAKTVINATGVFVDQVLQMDAPGKKPLVRPSQGVHLVFDKETLPAEKALMIPETADGRVLFAVPWHHHVLVGTTDTPLHESSLEPVAMEKEINFILETLRQYVQAPPARKDIKAVFAGLRPLAAPENKTNSTKEISRNHKLMVSPSGLITITGGKWTTYRKMAQDAVNKAIEAGSLPPKKCTTKNLPIHGYEQPKTAQPVSVYGTDQQAINYLITENPALGKKLLPEFSYTGAEVVWAVRSEMARTVEDVLARRLRLLFLDARAAMKAAPLVAHFMRLELGYSEDWEKEQLNQFTELARNYLPEANLHSDYESLTEVTKLSS